MRQTILTIGMAAYIVAGLAAQQSLGDLARQEEERRKTVKAPSKVITNKDLGAVPASASPPAPAPSPAASPTSKPAEGAKDKGTPEKGPERAGKDQAYWAARRKELQTELDRDESYHQAMQSRVNGLTTDFTNRDDPAQRAVVQSDRQKALADLARLKRAIVDDKKAIVDFEEEARRAGVPPGWLR